MRKSAWPLALLGVLAAAACGGAVRESHMEEPWITRPKEHLVQDAGVDNSATPASGSLGTVLKLQGATRHVDFGVPVADVRPVGERLVGVVPSESVAGLGDVVLASARSASRREQRLQRLLQGARADAGIAATCVGAACESLVLAWVKKYGTDDQVHVTQVSVGGKVLADQRLTKTQGWKVEPCIASTSRGYLALWVETLQGKSTVSVVPLDVQLRKTADTHRLSEFGGVSGVYCMASSEGGVDAAWRVHSEGADRTGAPQVRSMVHRTRLDARGVEMAGEGAPGQHAPMEFCAPTPEGQWCPENASGNSSAIWAFIPWPAAN